MEHDDVKDSKRLDNSLWDENIMDAETEEILDMEVLDTRDENMAHAFVKIKNYLFDTRSSIADRLLLEDISALFD